MRNKSSKSSSKKRSSFKKSSSASKSKKNSSSQKISIPAGKAWTDEELVIRERYTRTWVQLLVAVLFALMLAALTAAAIYRNDGPLQSKLLYIGTVLGLLVTSWAVGDLGIVGKLARFLVALWQGQQK